MLAEAGRRGKYPRMAPMPRILRKASTARGNVWSRPAARFLLAGARWGVVRRRRSPVPAQDFVCLDRPIEPLQVELAYMRGLHACFDCAECPLTDDDLARLRLVAK